MIEGLLIITIAMLGWAILELEAIRTRIKQTNQILERIEKE